MVTFLRDATILISVTFSHEVARAWELNFQNRSIIKKAEPHRVPLHPTDLFIHPSLEYRSNLPMMDLPDRYP